jgi:nitrous oxidase accessory protein
MLEVLDFLERLAPFTSPDLLLRDERPLMTAEFQLEHVAQARAAEADEASTGSPASTPTGPDAYELLRRSLGRD